MDTPEQAARQGRALPIRAEQLVTILHGDDRGLIERVAARLAERHPEGVHGVPPGELRRTLHGFCSRMADRYGIVASRDLLRMIGFAQRRGWALDLDEDGEWVRAILLDRRSPAPTRRVDRLEAALRQREAIEARNRAIDARIGPPPRALP